MLTSCVPACAMMSLEACRQRSSAPLAAALGLAGVLGVLFWYRGALHGDGDLRAYLLLQVLTLLLIPLWQWLYRRPRGERLAFGAALGLYALAKVAELLDHPLAALLPLSGHTLKHLLSVAATAVVAVSLRRRRRGARLAADATAVAPSPHNANIH